MYRKLITGLVLILCLLEYRFWFASDSIFKTRKLVKTLRQQDQEIADLARRNNIILEHVNYLKSHPVAIEEQARYELGMVKHGEKYYQIVDTID